MSTPVFPLNRVTDVLRRMDDNSSQSEAMKTCFGILAIMSREDVNKVLIARDGMETILNVMTQHVDKTDVQESGCDLLWSLAFNNAAVKDTIAKNGGASVLVRALKRHCKSSDFLKSACGALSNMCQSKLNQEGVASQGGLQPLVGSIHIHQNNPKLLPFIFDALASLIVSNEENARIVSSLGIVPLIVSSLGRHKGVMEVVKSGCHALAILSDVKGQASKIAFAGGVPVILSLLDTHPSYSDLHRVAAVVLLRMLQESAHVGREITANEGVRVLLKSLEKGGAQHDTVAAVTHILFTVTNPSSPSSANIEAQLWLSPNKAGDDEGAADGSSSSDTNRGGRGGRLVSKLSTGGSNGDLAHASLGVLQLSLNKSGDGSGSPSGRSGEAPGAQQQQQTALGGLIIILGQYSDRKDVVRAACRLLNNLGGFPGVVAALERLGVVERVLECVGTHGETRDVVDSATAMLKAVHRRGVPSTSASSGSLSGLVHIFKIKQHDEDASLACVDTAIRLLEAPPATSASPQAALARSPSKPSSLLANAPSSSTTTTASSSSSAAEEPGRPGWELEIMAVCAAVLSKLASDEQHDQLIEVQQHEGRGGRNSPSLGSQGQAGGAGKQAAVAKRLWTKTTPRLVERILRFVELVCGGGGSAGAAGGKQASAVTSTAGAAGAVPSATVLADLHAALSQLLEGPSRDSELSRHMERVLPLVAPKKNAAQERADEEKARAAAAAAAGKNSTGADRPSVGVLWGNRGGGAGADASSKQANRSNPPVRRYPTTVTATGQTIPKVWLDVEADSGAKQLQPLHPSKYFVRHPGEADHDVPRLLETWPTYLERLVVSPNSMLLSRDYGATFGNYSSDRLHVVYEGGSAAGRNIASRCATPVPYLVPQGGCGAPFEHSLTFDSEFESGNLLRAVQRGDAAYDLFLRSDLHTGGHTQWFYFAVSNTHPAALVRLADQGVQVPPVRARFNIVNLTKPDSLFNLGMRPVVYSCLDAATKGSGWLRAGSDISYVANHYSRNNAPGNGEGANCYYTLSFTIEFHNPKDTVLIAYSYPYTVADYQAHLSRVLSRPASSDYIRQSRLCTTLGGEECHLLVITNFRDKESRDRIGPITFAQTEAWKVDQPTAPSSSSRAAGAGGGKPPQRQALKPAFFISCRVHPGETPASWMLKGMLDFLTSDCKQAVVLRNAFVIFVVPILNPDGVIYGNNRCSLAGVDLNRQWKVPIKGLHPTVWHLKTLMGMQRRIRDVHLYVDLHGHSRKYNVFMYGCDDKRRPKPQVRAFPRFFSMHHVGKKYVCYADCSFHVKKGREATARVVVARELNIPCSFTLEATFCGSNYGPLKFCHMNIGHLQEVGAAMCDAILNFSISEGKVLDALLVPANVRAVAQVESAIALEDGSVVVGMGQVLVSANEEALRLAELPAEADVFPGVATVTGLGAVGPEDLDDMRPGSQSQPHTPATANGAAEGWRQGAAKEDEDVDSGSDDGGAAESDSDTQSTAAAAANGTAGAGAGAAGGNGSSMFGSREAVTGKAISNSITLGPSGRGLSASSLSSSSSASSTSAQDSYSASASASASGGFFAPSGHAALKRPLPGPGQSLSLGLGQGQGLGLGLGLTAATGKNLGPLLPTAMPLLPSGGARGGGSYSSLQQQPTGPLLPVPPSTLSSSSSSAAGAGGRAAAGAGIAGSVQGQALIRGGGTLRSLSGTGPSLGQAPIGPGAAGRVGAAKDDLALPSGSGPGLGLGPSPSSAGGSDRARASYDAAAGSATTKSKKKKGSSSAGSKKAKVRALSSHSFPSFSTLPLLL